MLIPKTLFLTQKSFKKLFLQVIRIQDLRSFSLEENLSMTASYKNGVKLRYALRSSFLTFYCFIIAQRQAILPANTFVLMKTSFVFVFSGRLDQDEYIGLSHMSSEEVFKTSCKKVFRTSSRSLAKDLPGPHFWEIYGQCRKFATTLQMFNWVENRILAKGLKY